MPALTEERRRDITKVVRSRGGERAGSGAQRAARRDDGAQGAAQGEADLRRTTSGAAQDEIQKLTDKHVAEIDQALADKEKEFMQV